LTSAANAKAGEAMIGEEIAARTEWPEDPEARFLHLLKLSLIGLAVERPTRAAPHRAAPEEDLEVRFMPLPPAKVDFRLEGRDWPVEGFTMVGLKRLNNLQACIENVIDDDVPGDLIEAGVWRGGATIFMRTLLKLRGATGRLVFVADSFEGLPPPDAENYPKDSRASLHAVDFLAVPLEAVQDNFRRFGVLDDGVRFVKGWFRDTLPTLADRTWSVIRLDGDLYESTTNALENLYPNLSPGGYVIIDDYAAETCRSAVDDYRAANGIAEEIRSIDWTGIYWRKAR
jgi:hypothetical protein